MRLDIPTRKQMAVLVKYSLLITVPLLLVAWWVVKNDPILVDVEQYLSRNTEITNKVGSVESMRLTKATYVQDAIDHSGNVTLGYNLYRYTVKGKSGSASVTVRAEKSSAKKVKKFIVKDIATYE